MVVCCGDALTDQHRVGTGTAVVLDLNRAEYAGFGNFDDVIRQIGGKFLVSAHIDTQILEVTCVDADHTSAGGNGPAGSPRACASRPERSSSAHAPDQADA